MADGASAHRKDVDAIDTETAQQRTSLRHAARAEGRRMIRFGGVGLANTILDFAIFWALVAAGAAPPLANIASFLSANLQSYLLNSRFTFRSEGRPAALSFSGYCKFAAAHVMSLAVSTVLIMLLAGRIGPVPAKLAALCFTFFWNYTASALLVFPGRKAAADAEGGRRG